MTSEQAKNASGAAKLDEIAEAIVAAVPDLDLKDQRIVLSIRRLIADGEPVSIDAIAGASEVRAEEVEAALSSWPGVFRDDSGRVVGFWGQAIAPLDPVYRFVTGGKTHYAWCALDTLFIPPALGGTVRVEAADPVTGDPVSLLVDGDGARDVQPAGAVVSMVVPDGPFDYDVIESFCHKVLFFASRESGESWTAKHEGTMLLSVPQAFEVGRALNAHLTPGLVAETGHRS
jgi:alkylmercury lyase